MDRDRWILRTREEIEPPPVYKCGIKGCGWVKKDIEAWEALRKYGEHFNTDHPGLAFGEARLLTTESPRRGRR